MATTTRKTAKPKRQTRAEREKSLVAQVGAWRLGCKFGEVIGLNRGAEKERLRWTHRSFLSRLRYLVNPNYLG